MSWMIDERLAFADVLGQLPPNGQIIDRTGFADISAWQLKEVEKAKAIFLQHLEEVEVPDTGRASVRTEIIQFHLTGEAFKRFNRFVRSYDCKAHRRRLLKFEQDKLKGTLKNRRCVNFTQVTVPLAAKIRYLQNKAAGLTAFIADENIPPFHGLPG